LNCPLPDVPSYSAMCDYWSLQSASPSSCPVGKTCSITITGDSFVYLEEVNCAFGSLSVPGTVVTQNTITCDVTPDQTGHVSLTITNKGKSITSNNLDFEFTASNNRAPVVRRHLNDDPVHVHILGESKSPDFGSIITIFQKIVHALGTDVIDLQIDFIMKLVPSYATGYWSRRGQTEVIGNALFKLVEEKHGIVTAVDFAACLAEQIDTVPNNAASCAERLNIDYNDLRKSSFSLKAYNLLGKTMIAANDTEATWSPTIIINDEVYCLYNSAPCKATKDTDFLRAICDAYKGPAPSACQ